MSKRDVIEAIEHEWNTFASLAGDFPEESRILPGAVGHWNVHEALLHVASWDNEVMLLVKNFEATGEKPWWDSLSGEVLDDLNERLVAERRNLDPSLIWAHFRNTHQVLVAFLETYEEHVFVEGTFTGDSINAETWKHYQGHGRDFTRFKESL
jgi:hypothetical protein